MPRREYDEESSAKGGAGAAAGSRVEGPDEETFVMPAAWRRQLRPRRGGIRRPAARPSPDALDYWLECISQRQNLLDQAFSSPESDARYAKAAKAYLAGEAEPVGAAAVVAIIGGWGYQRSTDVVDAWVRQHGLPFAAESVVETQEVESPPFSSPTWRAVPPETSCRNRENLIIWVHRVRALLAETDEDTYQKAVSALSGLRSGGHRRRIAVSYLLPTEKKWVAECIADPGPSGTNDRTVRSLLFQSLNDSSQVAELVEAGGTSPFDHNIATVGTIAEGVGSAVVPLAEEHLRHCYINDSLKAAFRILTELPTDRAFGVLLDHIDDKLARPALLDAARRYPLRAARMLAEAVLAAGEGPHWSRQVLTGHVSAHRELVEARLAEFSPEVAGLLDELLHPAGLVAEVGADALPELLVRPPWERGRKPAKPRVVRGLTVTAEPRVAWLPGEREAWSATKSSNRTWVKQYGLRKTPEEMARDVRRWPNTVAGMFADGPAEVLRPLLPDWKPDSASWDRDMALRPVAARWELAALPALLSAASASPAANGPNLLPYLTTEVAQLVVHWLPLKSSSGVARAWLTRHGRDAAVLLIPDAVGPPGRARIRAEHALRFIAAEHGADTVREATTGYGAEAAAAVDQLLSADPLESALPARMPRLPVWAEPPLLPQVLLKGGDAALPTAAVRHLVTMLAISKPGEEYPGVALVREVCDAESLAGFVWALFEQWRPSGMDPKESWTLHALSVLGDDDTVRRLTPVLRAWPGQDAHHWAVEGLDVLAAFGSDIALLHLHSISQRVKFKALKQRAKKKIAEVAAGLGLSGEQLADRLVPDFGLDAGGSTVVDYGSRRFTVGFDEHLRPYVLDQDGKRRKDLPQPGARDDAELAPAERKRFMALKKDIRTIATDQVRRLESAMVAGRTWPAQEFHELFVAHPLLSHLVRRLVWLCEPAGDSGSVTAFRVAEDRTFADAADDEFALPDDAAVRIAHPLHLGDDLATWAGIFADYEILQPFPQLGRPVHRLTAEEAAGTQLARFKGAFVDTGKLHGWERGEPQDAGLVHWVSRRVAEERWVVVSMDGFGVSLSSDSGATVEVVWLCDSPGDSASHAERSTLTFAELDPVAASEILADLEELVAE